MNSILDAVREQCRCGGFCEDGLVCESHPWLGWLHDDCGAPGMPCSQPIRDPALRLSGETFLTHEEVYASGDIWGHVRSLGLRPEDYEAIDDHLRCGWYLVRKSAPR